MRKNRKNAGFTLIEMLVAIVILVFLIMGIGVGMDAGTRVYRDATFESDSATLAGILNTSIGDILRYSINVRKPTDEEMNNQISHNVSLDEAEKDSFYVFTSLDYGIQDAYFCIPRDGAEFSGYLSLRNLRNGNVTELVNTGAYPDLAVSDFKISFTPRTGTGVEGSYFEVSYTISSTVDTDKERDVQYVVRLMND